MKAKEMLALYMLNVEDTEPGYESKLEPFWKNALIDLKRRASGENQAMGMGMSISGNFDCQDDKLAILDSDIIRIIHKIFKEDTELQNGVEYEPYIWFKDLTEQLPYTSVDAIIRNVKENLYDILDNYYDSGRYYLDSAPAFYKLMKYMPDLSRSWNEELNNGLMILINPKQRTKPNKETLVKPFINFLLSPHEFKLDKLSGFSQRNPRYSHFSYELPNAISFKLCLHGKLSNIICPHFYIDFSISHENFLRLLHNEEEFVKWFKKSLKGYRVELKRDLYFKVMKFKLGVELTRDYVEGGSCEYKLYIKTHVYLDESLNSLGKRFKYLFEQLK